MIRTQLCDLLGVDLPIVLAPFGPWEQVELAAAVSNAGALGSLGTAVRSTDELRAQWQRLRELTDRPFAINHTGRPLDEERSRQPWTSAQQRSRSTWESRPTSIARAHDRGILWIQTVGDVRRGEAALGRRGRRAGRAGHGSRRQRRLGGDHGARPGGGRCRRRHAGRRRRRHRRRPRDRGRTGPRRAGRQPGHPLPRHDRDVDRAGLEGPHRGCGRRRHRQGASTPNV